MDRAPSSPEVTPGRRPSRVAALLPRVPVAALGVVIAASALQASCNGTVDDSGPEDGGRDEDALSSEDSAADRADGMRYGDGYGGRDAHAPADARVNDAEHGDSSCVTSTVTYPPSTGCPAGNHVWACWPPTSATAGLPASHYSVLTLCGELVVVDETTKLMWDQEEKPGQYTWVEAAAACTGSRRAGFSDWRLPSSNELMSLVDYSRTTTPVTNPTVFAFQSPENHQNWSSTATVQQAGYAWQQYGSGGIYPQSVSTPGYVRCVR
jgi:hypothetical protein